MARTIASVVEKELNEYPQMLEMMSEKILNLSALAKKLQPAIEKTLMKSASHGSIVIALQRLQADMKPYESVNPGHFLHDLSVVSGLEEITVANTVRMHTEIIDTANTPDWMGNVAIASMGHQGINVMAPKGFSKRLRERISEKLVLGVVPNLSALSLKRSPGQVTRSGVLYYPIQILAWHNISSVEIITTPKDITIYIHDKDVGRAFSIIYDRIEAIKHQT